MNNVIFVVLNILLAMVNGAEAQQGTHGGDQCENRFREITANFYSWIYKDQAKDLSFPTPFTTDSFKKAILSLMKPYLDRENESLISMSCVDHPVLVDGNEKMCIWRDPKLDNTILDGKIHIDCNVGRFYDPQFKGNLSFETEQYKQVLHEWNSIIGVEPSTNGTSDYELTNQITTKAGGWEQSYRLVISANKVDYVFPEGFTAGTGQNGAIYTNNFGYYHKSKDGSYTFTYPGFFRANKAFNVSSKTSLVSLCNRLGFIHVIREISHFTYYKDKYTQDIFTKKTRPGEELDYQDVIIKSDGSSEVFEQITYDGGYIDSITCFNKLRY